MQWKKENVLILLSLLVLAFFLVNMFSGGGQGRQQSKELIYSDFKNLVAGGEISNAQFVGDTLIEGFTLDGTPYRTYIPENDSKLVDFLRHFQVQINYTPEQGLPWYLNLLIHWGPFLLIFGIWIFLMRRMQGMGAGKLFSLGRSRAQKMDPDKMKITFKDVAGVEEAKADLEETIEFLKDPTKFRKLGGRIPKGMLMSGPPGTGKTLLAKGVAGEADVPFFSMSGSDFVEMFVGIGASRVRDLFEEGRRNAPCILFIDEIDAVGRSRGAGLGSGNDEREQTLNQLLVEMDGFDATEGVIIIAATNRPDVLDPALLRPGRFDRQVHVPLPDIKGREEILKIHSEKVQMAENVDLSVIARGTPGFSGADLKNLVNEAALGAARHNKTALSLADFEWARDKVMMGPERRSMLMTEREKQTTAYHEAGHALVSVLLPKSDPIHKVTIVPRGRAMGLTAYLPENDVQSYDREFLTNRITIAMGGRAAEELIFKELTTGASNDIQQATDMARNMICRWGMSDKLGPIVLGSDDQQHVLGRDIGSEREYSEDTAVEIDKEMRSTIKTHYRKAKKLLKDNIKVLHEIAEVLIKEETIEGKRILELLGNKKPKVLQPQG
ncbi:MAG: ATP-dependent zinc metalloprotease FtsH [SAR324 cluster bacterium]|jgi:cell division protease FtsH|nr:ATP-dependent zinc metalloprotease FtsH [SAR324 cluster bacterium]MEE1576523.1 ATP-dependent zinc metalloprotease FtsH [Deltaproteobacteria bacterium]MDP6245299.1 ATP-dependent zinc metalloprotease FtsH [SAR324 cluster bacterium]MDP6464694.1 ATP-dependent zinc metalloprotease FtsH [SAR324 cluster bacterium]MDP6728542.1 ATP-dependent zinc metalloprotease FtsH [SAR324 cluster bacterium]|tara:strand:+ start:9432 stop:11264 length:1833 start_codon:yes stop_codon:yes gene_type:complete